MGNIVINTCILIFMRDTRITKGAKIVLKDTMPDSQASVLGQAQGAEETSIGFAFRSFHQDAINFIDQNLEKKEYESFMHKISFIVGAVLLVIIVTSFFAGSQNITNASEMVYNSTKKIISLEEKFFETLTLVRAYPTKVQESISYSASVIGSSQETITNNFLSQFDNFLSI